MLTDYTPFQHPANGHYYAWAEVTDSVDTSNAVAKAMLAPDPEDEDDVNLIVVHPSINAGKSVCLLIDAQAPHGRNTGMSLAEITQVDTNTDGHPELNSSLWMDTAAAMALVPTEE